MSIIYNGTTIDSVTYVSNGTSTSLTEVYVGATKVWPDTIPQIWLTLDSTAFTLTSDAPSVFPATFSTYNGAPALLLSNNSSELNANPIRMFATTTAQYNLSNYNSVQIITIPGMYNSTYNSGPRTYFTIETSSDGINWTTDLNVSGYGGHIDDYRVGFYDTGKIYNFPVTATGNKYIKFSFPFGSLNTQLWVILISLLP